MRLTCSCQRRRRIGQHIIPHRDPDRNQTLHALADCCRPFVRRDVGLGGGPVRRLLRRTNVFAVATEASWTTAASPTAALSDASLPNGAQDRFHASTLGEQVNNPSRPYLFLDRLRTINIYHMLLSRPRRRPFRTPLAPQYVRRSASRRVFLTDSNGTGLGQFAHASVSAPSQGGPRSYRLL